MNPEPIIFALIVLCVPSLPGAGAEQHSRLRSEQKKPQKHSLVLPGTVLTVCMSVCLTQELFGRNGFEYRMFQMFQSSSKDLLFSDDTACLANLQDGTTYRKYLGPEYLKALDNMGQCLHSGE